MYDFAAEPGNNELTVSEGEIITITNPVREMKNRASVHCPDLFPANEGKDVLGGI